METLNCHSVLGPRETTEQSNVSSCLPLSVCSFLNVYSLRTVARVCQTSGWHSSSHCDSSGTLEPFSSVWPVSFICTQNKRPGLSQLLTEDGRQQSLCLGRIQSVLGLDYETSCRYFYKVSRCHTNGASVV